MSIRCYFCGADTAPQHITVDERWDGRLVSIKGVPADVCPQCGETYYGPEAVRRMAELRQQPEKSTAVAVPIYNFARTNATSPQARKTGRKRSVAARSGS